MISTTLSEVDADTKQGQEGQDTRQGRAREDTLPKLLTTDAVFQQRSPTADSKALILTAGSAIPDGKLLADLAFYRQPTRGAGD